MVIPGIMSSAYYGFEHGSYKHAIDFYVDENAFITGIRTLSNLVIDYFEINKQ